MLLISSTVDFTIQGISHPNIPILVNMEMKVVQPVLKFIVYQSVQNGRIQSNKTILSYANSLYDYFSFLEANNLSWNKASRNDNDISTVALYRNWSVSLTGNATLKTSTINTRLAAIRLFYEYCHKQKMINFLPWVGVNKVSYHNRGAFLGNTNCNPNINSTDLRLKTFKQPPKVLTLEQAKDLIGAIKSPTLALIVKLALTTGMRREELITFQRENVFKPYFSQINKRLPVDLISQPGKQKTKAKRPRTIYVPAPLMMELYEYTLYGEGVKRFKLSEMDTIQSSANLFFNYLGEPFSERSLNTLLNRLHKNGHINFTVTPHMLRHTYATIELYGESQTKDMAQALAWVRDRLGHSSINTTMIYIHCIEQLDDHELLRYQRELLEMIDA